MLGVSRQRCRGLAIIPHVAAVLVVALPFCLLAGTMAGQHSCRDLGSSPRLCSEMTSHADHLLAVPAPLAAPLVERIISARVTLYAQPTFPSLGFLSIAAGRAPPLG